MVAQVELFTQRLSDDDFDRVAELVECSVGIHLAPHKRSMVELRVAKRARVLGMADLDGYCDFVFDPVSGGIEQAALIDSLTTNKTDFFREAEHFTYLTAQAIPALRQTMPELGSQPSMRLWSAGCSTGEEPYSIAMSLLGYGDGHAPFDFSVLATDVSSAVVRQAVRAVYPEESACAVPVELRRRYLLRNKDHSLRLVRIAPEARAHVRFARHNLFASPPPDPEPFHAIFCRNVIIYFERDTQVKVLDRLARALVPGGYLFVGHSETLHGMPLPFERVGPTVYRKVGC